MKNLIYFLTSWILITATCSLFYIYTPFHSFDEHKYSWWYASVLFYIVGFLLGSVIIVKKGVKRETRMWMTILFIMIAMLLGGIVFLSGFSHFGEIPAPEASDLQEDHAL